MNGNQGDLRSIFGVEFDPFSIKPQKDFEVIPPGEHLCLIDRAEVKITKKGDGHYIELEMTIQGEEYKNRKLWDRINIDNPNSECVRIGLEHLAALGQAIRINELSDSAQLVGHPVIAHVKVRNEQNEIRTYSAPEQLFSFYSPSSVQPQQTAPPEQPEYRQPTSPQQFPHQVTHSEQSSPQQNQPTTDEKPPWER